MSGNAIKHRESVLQTLFFVVMVFSMFQPDSTDSLSRRVRGLEQSEASGIKGDRLFNKFNNGNSEVPSSLASIGQTVDDRWAVKSQQSILSQ